MLGTSTETLSESIGTISSTVIKTYVITSEPIAVTVQDTTAPSWGEEPEFVYPETAISNTIVEIFQNKATDIGGIDEQASHVLITYRGEEIRTINLSNWANETGYNAETGNIDYQLTGNGNYVITYFIQDKHGNVNDERTYTVAVGDCEAPVINLPSDLVEQTYAFGSMLTLDFNKIKLAISDNITNRDVLLDTLKIKLINTSNNNEVENIGNADENIYTYNLSEAGTYRLEVSVSDEADWETINNTIVFEVPAPTGLNIYEIIAIVAACLVVVGIILGLVIRKVKKNKKTQSKKS